MTAQRKKNDTCSKKRKDIWCWTEGFFYCALSLYFSLFLKPKISWPRCYSTIAVLQKTLDCQICRSPTIQHTPWLIPLNISVQQPNKRTRDNFSQFTCRVIFEKHFPSCFLRVFRKARMAGRTVVEVAQRPIIVFGRSLMMSSLYKKRLDRVTLKALKSFDIESGGAVYSSKISYVNRRSE